MLDGLDEINWRDLSHAYGPADDVPELLRALAEGNCSAEDAVGEFWGNIWHQGTVYEASAYAVPFLLELVQEEKIADREWLLMLLDSLASGSSYLDVHEAMPEQADREFQAGREQEINWVRAAHEAVAKGIPMYLRLLQNERFQIRTVAACLLSHFPESAGETLTVLRSSLGSETQNDAQASLMLCLGRLGDRDADTGRATEAALSAGKDDPRRRAAALALLWRDKSEAAPAAVQVVEDVLADEGGFIPDYAFSVWDIDADPGGTFFEALLLRGPEKAVDSLLSILGRLEDPADILVDTLIATSFSASKGAITAGTLTRIQRRILSALLEAEQVWEGEKWTNGFSAEWYGLPESREALERLMKAETQ